MWRSTGEGIAPMGRERRVGQGNLGLFQGLSVRGDVGEYTLAVETRLQHWHMSSRWCDVEEGQLDYLPCDLASP